MMESFLAFNYNALTNFAYLIKSNIWLVLMIAALAATVVLKLKEEVDTAVNEEQNIL